MWVSPPVTGAAGHLGRAREDEQGPSCGGGRPQGGSRGSAGGTATEHTRRTAAEEEGDPGHQDTGHPPSQRHKEAGTCGHAGEPLKQAPRGTLGGRL